MADKRKSGDGFDLAPGAAKKLKVDELRAALEARGLDTEGLKATLLERLEAAVAAEEAAGALRDGRHHRHYLWPERAKVSSERGMFRLTHAIARARAWQWHSRRGRGRGGGGC